MPSFCEYCRHSKYKDDGYCYMFKEEPNTEFCGQNTAISEMFNSVPALQLVSIVTTQFQPEFDFRNP